MKILDWWYAICVCKKYGIKWNPFFKMTRAEYCFSYGLFGVTSKIHMNPFYEGGLDSFMHEVGHCLWYKKLWASSKSIEDFEQKSDSTCILEKEYIAWRFAKLARRGRFNHKRAQRMFGTYFKSKAREVGAIQAADSYYQYDQRLMK